MDDGEESTPLMLAAAGNHIDIVSYLLEQNADIEATNKIGFTPLLSACISGHLKVVELLVARNADVLVTDHVR